MPLSIFSSNPQPVRGLQEPVNSYPSEIAASTMSEQNHQPADEDVCYGTTVAGRENEAGNHAGHVTETLFDQPMGICLHGDGSLFVADTGNASIKTILCSGTVVTTVATSAHGLSCPVAVASCPKSKKVYIADVGCFSIFCLSSAGNLERISGDGKSGYLETDGTRPAQWGFPCSLAVDKRGDLLVCDRKNHCIRKIFLTKVNDSTVYEAGCYPTELLCGSAGQAGCDDGEMLYARFDTPAAIAIAPDGSFFVSDLGSGRLRRVYPDATVITLPGIFAGASGIALDATGRLYIANTDETTILRYDSEQRIEVMPFYGLSGPTSMALDCDIGSLFVIDQHAVKSFPVARILPPSPSVLDSDLENLFKRTMCGDDTVYTDVVFLVDGTPRRAHRSILAARCPELAKLFSGPGLPQEDVVIKEDVTVKSFDEFLRFIYTDRVHVDIDSWEHLLYLSCRFGIDRLKDLVEEYTLRMVRLDDVGEVLTVAHQAKALRLKEACFKIMVKNFAYFQGKIAEIAEHVPDLLLEMLIRMPK